MKKTIVFFTLLLLSAVSIAIGISLGSETINPIKIFYNKSDLLSTEIITRLRLPRAITAFITGSSLAVCGVVFQSFFRNPLADPFITGISGGAALGYAISVVLAIPPHYGIFFSIGGSILAIFILSSLISNFSGSTSSFILSGISLSFIFSSCVMLIFAIAKSESVHKIIIWMMGDLNSANNAAFSIYLAPLFILAIWSFHRHIDLISLGDDFAKTSGVNPWEVLLIFLLTSVLVALSVLMGGIIPFIGLMIPHIIRPLSSSLTFYSIPFSALCGGAFLVICDSISRSIISPYELPVGVITGLLGGLFFFMTIFRQRSTSE